MAAELTSGAQSRYEQDRDWLNASLGGPILENRLYFYGRTTADKIEVQRRQPLRRAPGTTAAERGFGKLTFTPTQSILLNASYRESKTVETGPSSRRTPPDTGTGYESRLKIFTATGRGGQPKSFVTVRYTHFANPTQGKPDYTATPTSPRAARDSTSNSLDTQGRFLVPTPVAGATDYNAFIQPIIDRYGYTQNGAQVGGGIVGYGLQFDDDDFFRTRRRSPTT